MSEAGFFEQRRASPAGFAMVVAMHAAVIGAVLLIKGPTVLPRVFVPTTIFNVPPERDPDPIPPERVEPQAQSVIRTVPTEIDLPIRDNNEIATVDLPPISFPTGNGTGGTVIGTSVEPPPPTPVRREAEIDRRYAAAFQPPYPTSEQRAQHEGTVRIRVTIGTDGRVRAVERVSATNDAFWAVAERQAMRHWRFRPATVDGRPVESTKVMTLHFRLADV